jgi:hypothetical protein
LDQLLSQFGGQDLEEIFFDLITLPENPEPAKSGASYS